jgi:hypothetical protein
MSTERTVRHARWKKPLLAAIVVVVLLGAVVALRSTRWRADLPPATVDSASMFVPLAPEPASIPDTLTLQGSGSQAIPFAIALDGAGTAHLVHGGDGRFVVKAILTGSQEVQLVATEGGYDGKAQVPGGPGALVEGLLVEASGSWTVAIAKS